MDRGIMSMHGCQLVQSTFSAEKTKVMSIFSVSLNSVPMNATARFFLRRPIG